MINSTKYNHLKLKNECAEQQSARIKRNRPQIMSTCLWSGCSVPPSRPQVNCLLVSCLTLMTAQDL